MIFVTVGTHEQPFNRLIKKIDELKGSGSLVMTLSFRLVFLSIGQSIVMEKSFLVMKKCLITLKKLEL